MALSVPAFADDQKIELSAGSSAKITVGVPTVVSCAGESSAKVPCKIKRVSKNTFNPALFYHDNDAVFVYVGDQVLKINNSSNYDTNLADAIAAIKRFREAGLCD